VQLLVRATLVAQILVDAVVSGRARAAQSFAVGNRTTHTPSSIEWPTVLVAVGCWGGWIALLVWHDVLPWPITVAGFALMCGWYTSLQHEVIHGHPTPWRTVNTALGWMPLHLWLPYRTYSDSHLLHHEVELTVPGVDPESFYVSPEQWERASTVRRMLLQSNRTFVGRLLVGPLLGPPALVWSEVRGARTDRAKARTWSVHLVAVGAIGWVVFGLAQVPVWQYLVGYTYLGLSVTYMRSFVEHLAVPAPGTRCAVVRSGRFFGLLYLNNNLHHTHHAFPSAAWYRLPRLTRELGAEEMAAEGAGLYRGYADVIRRYGVRPFSQPVDPLAEHVAS